MLKALSVSIVTAVLGLTACTTEQAYESARGWQQQQCNKTPDRAEAERCMARASTTYDSYRKQTGEETR